MKRERDTHKKKDEGREEREREMGKYKGSK